MAGRITWWGRVVPMLRAAALAAALAAVLSLLASTALIELLGGQHGPSISAPSVAAVSSVPLAAQGAISAALGGDGRSYRVTPAPGGGFQALSAAQRVRSRFYSSGVELSAGAATLGMSLEEIGYGTSLQAVEHVTPTVQANRVAYLHAQVGEWYANGPFGIEQGFTLPRAPSAVPSGRLTLSLALSGSLRGVAARDGQAVTFTRPGAPSLHYGALVATDARGHRLPSSMHLEGGRLLLRVDDRGAVYPLRIDPLVQRGEALRVGEEAGAAGSGRLGFSVALSADGNTSLVGAPADGNFAGAVWMFVRSGGVWSQQGPKLTGGEAGGEGACGENA